MCLLFASHIHTHTQQLLEGPVKKFNIIAVYHLHFDVKALEEFAQRCPTPNLSETFTEIRQVCVCFVLCCVVLCCVCGFALCREMSASVWCCVLCGVQFIDLFLSGRVEDICEKSIREEKYSQLSPTKLVKILDKYKEIGLFSSLPKHIPNVKRKGVDAAIKALKTLAKQ
jgi:hypothetical protein